MSNILRFGIPSLDELFGEKDSKGCYGILLPSGSNERQSSSGVSICISGPDGTGKSVLSLHLASTYLADCAEAQGKPKGLPKVLYVSTDLKFKMAEKMWINFGLDYPNLRTVPFADSKKESDKQNRKEEIKKEELRIRLRDCTPFGMEDDKDSTDQETKPLEDYLVTHQDKKDNNEMAVYFVDLASYTAGDDWGYVNRVLSLLEKPGKEQPRHLIVFDSVEGFEMLVGERDAFGESQTRRSRIAQVMRSAAEKCHTLLIVEEPEEGKRLPEEFVTDVVLRLRSVMVKDYVRRTLELEKVRGHSHTRGQHSYVIRSGSGSTTGNQPNPDDPVVPKLEPPTDDKRVRGPHQSYLHVCQSLHTINREIMVAIGKGRPAKSPKHFAAFGIYYLDDMLDGKEESVKREQGDDQRGLPCSTVTALIGNSETQKSPLGTAFLSRCFTDYARRFLNALKEARQADGGTRQPAHAVTELAPVNRRRQDRIAKRLQQAGIPKRLRQAGIPARGMPDSHFKRELGDYWELDRPGVAQGFRPRRISTEVINAAMKLNPPNCDDQGKGDGIPVLLTTQDVHAEKLARDFLPWLLQDVPELMEMEEEDDFAGCLAALRIMMEEYTICRRLEIHDLPSAMLIHIVRCAVKEAQLILRDGDVAKDVEERFPQNWGIRVVFDDFSILKNTYVEIRDEPLLVRFLVFYLGREGVTSLLIDTQSGRLDTITTSELESELRSLVDHRIYTWRFPFLGENRVAISVIPPISPHTPTLMQELRVVANSYPETNLVPLVVDPLFEFYSGIEKGEPQPIPLEIRLFEESPAFGEYAARENVRYCDIFTPVARHRKGEGDRVIIGVPADEYDQYRDFCYLQRDTRLDHTLILQVDEFWTVRRRQVRRTSAFQPQWHYLNDALVAEQEDMENVEAGEDQVKNYRAVKRKAAVLKSGWAADPFRIFEGPKPKLLTKQRDPEELTRKDKKPCRADKFVWHGYNFYTNNNLTNELKESINRVPFMWDFGFLLCREDPWLETGKTELSFLKNSHEKKWKESNQKKMQEKYGEDWEKSHKKEWKKIHERAWKKDEKFRTVASVWEGLPRAITKDTVQKTGERPSWRVFLEACYHVARAQTYARGTPVPALDLPVALPQSLSCLILEIWASEIYEKLRLDDKRNKTKEAKRFLRRMGWRDLNPPEDNLIVWLEKYKFELFRTWLLLREVLDMDEWTEAIKRGNIRNRNVNPSTVAARHWYKTACLATESLSYDDPIVVVGLPGYFSMRGDWFLTVAGGSRSERLASLALDMLNSRRANYERLQAGLGLPTRRIVDEEKELSSPGEEAESSSTPLDDMSRLKTRILTSHRKEEKKDDKKGSDAAADSEKLSGRSRHVMYDELIELGGPLGRIIGGKIPANPKNFHWLWRSRLRYFHRHAKIWQDWVGEMILFWQYMYYVNRDEWTVGFELYDQVDPIRRAKVKFEERCETLARHLKQATPPDRQVINTLPA